MVNSVLILVSLLVSFQVFGNVKNCLKLASSKTGVNYSTLSKISYLESRWNRKAKNPKSSARGLFQVIKSTESYLRKKYNIKGSIYNACTNSLMGAYLAKEHITFFENKGISSVTDLDLYLAHFLGVTKAYKIKRTNNKKQICRLLPRECRYNPFMKGKSVGRFKKFFNKKLNRVRVK